MSKPASFALPSDPSLFSDLDQVDNNQSGVSSIPPQRSQLAPFTTPLGVDPSAPNYNGLVEQYRTKLTEMKARLGVSTQPILKGAVFEIPVYFSDAYGSQPRVDEAKRPLPTFVTTSPYFRVQLASPIVRWRSDPESDRLSSEVWRGLMSPRQSLLGTNTPTMKVVVKFLQPSLFYLPLHPWSTNPDHQARKEAGGYDHLVSLQGSVIPYFFGKHIVATPSGELAWALVTEDIVGKTFAELLTARHGDCHTECSVDKTCEILQSAAKGLQAMHKFNIRHWNASPANLIVPDVDHCDRVVWIDFNPVHRLVDDKNDDGDDEPWEAWAEDDAIWLWGAAASYFSLCDCSEEANALIQYKNIPPAAPAGPAPTAEITEPCPPVKSLWEAGEEWEYSKRMGRVPGYISEIRNPSD